MAGIGLKRDYMYRGILTLCWKFVMFHIYINILILEFMWKKLKVIRHLLQAPSSFYKMLKLNIYWDTVRGIGSGGNTYWTLRPLWNETSTTAGSTSWWLSQSHRENCTAKGCQSKIPQSIFCISEPSFVSGHYFLIENIQNGRLHPTIQADLYTSLSFKPF